MKQLKDFITKKQNFLIKNKNDLKDYDYYDYHPKNKYELIKIIVDLLKKGITDLNCINVSEITNMNNLFWSINLNINVSEIDISNWDVSNVTSMRSMFEDCKNFNSDLSNWNVSNVNNMGSMFYNCEIFNSDLSNWAVSNVTIMTSLFEDCKNFNSDLSNWDVSNVKHINGMFDGCKKLKENNLIPSWWNRWNS